MPSAAIAVTASEIEIIGGDFDSEFIATKVAYLVGAIYEVRVSETADAATLAYAMTFLPVGCIPLRVYVPEVSLLDPFVDEIVFTYLPPTED